MVVFNGWPIWAGGGPTRMGDMICELKVSFDECGGSYLPYDSDWHGAFLAEWAVGVKRKKPAFGHNAGFLILYGYGRASPPAWLERGYSDTRCR